MTPGNTRVLVLFGGRSAEHEISIISARFIVDSMDRERFTPVLVGISPDGRWHAVDETQLPTSKDPRRVKVPEGGPTAWLRPMPDRSDGEGTLHVEGRAPMGFDVAFPVLHGPMGEDGTVQGLLELASVPYVGAGVTGSAVSMDKLLQKQIFEQAELPILPYRAVRRLDWSKKRDAVVEDCLALCTSGDEPLFVKPANMGSSLGIRKAKGRAALVAAIDHAFAFDTKLVVEKGLEGPREIELAVLGNHEPEVSLPGEIVVGHGDGFYSYDAKYIDDGAALTIPAELDHTEQSAVQLLALQAYRQLDVMGMARVDLFLNDGGEVYLNEVNTIPGFTEISMFPQLWRASGLGSEDLVTRLIELALERHAERSALRTRR
ncbi:MAG TPA: D-alanine--D-alanine ligase [Polyangiaceae bacterium]|nr:D-alanine--D-alanine ligase [Polyangiaceae bacterium]